MQAEHADASVDGKASGSPRIAAPCTPPPQESLFWIGFRMIAPTLAAIILMLAVVFGLLLPGFKKALMNQRKLALRELTSAAREVLVQNHEREKAGELSRAQAQKAALDVIRSLRYGPEGKDYFWVNDMECRMIAHPFRPDREGHDYSDVADPNRVYFIRAGVELVRKDGEGYIDYLWQWKDDPTQVAKKTSFVIGFEPWQWVVGTGMYLRDVQQELAPTTHKAMAICLIVVGGVSLLALFMTLRVMRSEKQTRQSESRLRNILAAATETAIIATDSTGKIVSFNAGAERLLGYGASEVVNRETPFLFHRKEDLSTRSETLRAMWAGPEAARGTFTGDTSLPSTENAEWALVTKSGQHRAVELTITPMYDSQGAFVGHVGIGQDVTERNRERAEREKLVSQLQQTQRIEAIGTLAGGIAHDFNNIIFGATGFTELALTELDPGGQPAGFLREAMTALRRAAELVRQILTFSRQGMAERKPMMLHPILKEALTFLRKSIPSTIEIAQKIESGCGPVLSDPTQFHQIVVNLCTNAFHAMQGKGGTITVNLDQVEIGSGEQADGKPLAPGPYVRLRVSDTGHGMDAELRKRIFDPYFTTKGVGEGTGLGLSTVHGIVESHKGAIRVASTIGEGTTFEVFLPVYAREETASDSGHDGADITGTERVLFVDDEESIALYAQEELRSLGYDVHIRTSSVEALAAFRAAPTRFDILVSDQDMPNLKGGELTQEVHRIRPDLPVVLCTGFSDVLTRKQSRELGIAECVSKPLLTSDLAGAIRRAVDSGSSTGRDAP